MEAESKVVIISGGSKGLGMGIAKQLLEEGYTVATFSRNKSPSIENLESNDNAGSFYWESVDGTDPERVRLFLKRVHKLYGQIDALVNNAGMVVDGVLTLMRSEDISRILALNLEGCIRLTRACVKYMLPRKKRSCY